MVVEMCSLDQGSTQIKYVWEQSFKQSTGQKGKVTGVCWESYIIRSFCQCSNQDIMASKLVSIKLMWHRRHGDGVWRHSFEELKRKDHLKNKA